MISEIFNHNNSNSKTKVEIKLVKVDTIHYRMSSMLSSNFSAPKIEKNEKINFGNQLINQKIKPKSNLLSSSTSSLSPPSPSPSDRVLISIKVKLIVTTTTTTVAWTLLSSALSPYYQSKQIITIQHHHLLYQCLTPLNRCRLRIMMMMFKAWSSVKKNLPPSTSSPLEKNGLKGEVHSRIDVSKQLNKNKIQELQVMMSWPTYTAFVLILLLGLFVIIHHLFQLLVYLIMFRLDYYQ